MQAGVGGGICECVGAYMCGHVGGFALGSPAGALVNISSPCCVCANSARSSLVSTVNADTLALVTCAGVLLACWNCCSYAIPSFMDAQLSSSDSSVLFAP